MNILENLKYTKSHEWVLLEGGTAKIGLTDHAQESLGDLVFVNLPSVGDAVTAGETMADVESVKAVSDVYSPVTGVVKAVNDSLDSEPGQINETPYEAWLVEVEGVTDQEDLLDAVAYEAFCAEED